MVGRFASSNPSQVTLNLYLAYEKKYIPLTKVAKPRVVAKGFEPCT